MQSLSRGDRCLCGAALPWEKTEYACALMTVTCACGRVYRCVGDELHLDPMKGAETGEAERAARLRAEMLARALGRALVRAEPSEEIIADLNVAHPSWGSELRMLLKQT